MQKSDLVNGEEIHAFVHKLEFWFPWLNTLMLHLQC